MLWFLICMWTNPNFEIREEANHVFSSTDDHYSPNQYGDDFHIGDQVSVYFKNARFC